MTVSELIAILEGFPGDTLCVSVGFDEHGYSDLEGPKMLMLKVPLNQRFTHDYLDADDTQTDGGEFAAIYIR